MVSAKAASIGFDVGGVKHLEASMAGKNPAERRNFVALFSDIVCYGTAISLIEPSTIIPALMGKLTESAWLIGFASASFYTMWLLPQLLAARYIAGSSLRKPWVIWPGFASRILMLSLAVGMIWIGEERKTLLLWWFLVVLIASRMVDGVVATAWTDLLGSSLQARARSRLLGYGQVFQGPLIMVAGVFLVPLILVSYPYPTNFAVLFFLSSLLMLLGWALLIRIEERPPRSMYVFPPLREYPRFLWKTIQEDPAFGRFLLIRFGFDLAGGASVFYTVYALQVLKQPSGEVLGYFVTLLILGRMLGALCLTPLSERWGERFGVRVGLFFSSLHLLIAILSVYSPREYAIWLLYGCTFLRGCERCTWSLGFLSWMLAHAPDEQRPIYIGLANLSTALGQFSPVLMGALLLLLSYTGVYLLCLGIALFTLWLTARLPEPREEAGET